VPKEIKDYVKGFYGKPPGSIDPKIKRKIIANEKPITVRPADLLEPAFNKIPDDVKPYVESDEDKITYALFPQIALDFFKKRKAKRENAKSGIAPERAAELERIAAISAAIVAYMKSTSQTRALMLTRPKSARSNWVLANRQASVECGA
jgi:pyruvate/oxaloacetate carboxyltransferase